MGNFEELTGNQIHSETVGSVESPAVSILPMELTVSNFSKLVKSERAKSGLSKTAFAQKIGVSLRTYQYMEKAERMPDLDNILHILDVLGYTTEIRLKLNIE